MFTCIFCEQIFIEVYMFVKSPILITRSTNLLFLTPHKGTDWFGPLSLENLKCSSRVRSCTVNLVCEWCKWILNCCLVDKIRFRQRWFNLVWQLYSLYKMLPSSWIIKEFFTSAFVFHPNKTLKMQLSFERISCLQYICCAGSKLVCISAPSCVVVHVCREKSQQESPSTSWY